MLKLFAGALIAVAAPAVAASPFDGTWKIDMSAAKFDTKPDVDALRGANYECSTCTPPYKLTANGKVQKVTGRDYADAMQMTVVDARTLRTASYKGGKMYSESTRTVSPDGETMTVAWRNNNNPQNKWNSGTTSLKRAAPAAAGVHAATGSWMLERNQPADPGTITLAVTADAVAWRNSFGESYNAKFGGPAVPVVGDRVGVTIAVKQVGDSYEQTTYLRGKPISVDTMTSVDANTFKLTSKDLRGGWVDELTFRRQ